MKKLHLAVFISTVFFVLSCTLPNSRLVVNLLTKEGYDFLPEIKIPNDVTKQPYGGIVALFNEFPSEYSYALMGKVVVPDSNPLSDEEKINNFKIIAGNYGANAIVIRDFDRYLEKDGIRYLMAYAIWIRY